MDRYQQINVPTTGNGNGRHAAPPPEPVNLVTIPLIIDDATPALTAPGARKVLGLGRAAFDELVAAGRLTAYIRRGDRPTSGRRQHLRFDYRDIQRLKRELARERKAAAKQAAVAQEPPSDTDRIRGEMAAMRSEFAAMVDELAKEKAAHDEAREELTALRQRIEALIKLWE